MTTNLTSALSDAQFLFDTTPALCSVVIALNEADPVLFVGITRGVDGPEALSLATTEAAALDGLAMSVGPQGERVPA